MKKNNGSLAFPFRVDNTDKSDVIGFVGEVIKSGDSVVYAGMMLVDYFAAHASDKDIDSIMEEHQEIVDDLIVAPYSRCTITRQQARYIHAERMLQERAK